MFSSFEKELRKIKKRMDAMNIFSLLKKREQNQTKKVVEEKRIFSQFEEELIKVDAAMKTVELSDIPQLFSKIPLSVFGNLLLNIPAEYPNIKAFFPSMVSEAVQSKWTGKQGSVLLNQSVIFLKTMVFGYAAITGKKIETASVLDYGCGWGRLIRLLYKFVPIENIYGVDPWDQSIEICNQHGLKGNLAISDYVPLSLPFERKFDLIFAFSVFSHLSEKTAHIVLNTLRKYIAEDGLLVITIRPKEYWSLSKTAPEHLRLHKAEETANEMLRMHDQKGFAFSPHDHHAPINGDITYGDTSIALTYLASNFPQWQVEAVEWNQIDPYQVILFMKPS